jgi:hypothetical protein
MRHVLIIMLLAGLCLRTTAQPVMPPGVRGADSGLATRSVSIYLGLERRLSEALTRGDREAAQQLLGEDFAFRSAADVDETSAADWLDGELHNPTEAANVRNLSVREFNDMAVVGFLLDGHRTSKSKVATTTLYVVDVWQQNPPHLMARYVAQPQHARPVSTRPTGRE